jgi:hypothetical protein
MRGKSSWGLVDWQKRRARQKPNPPPEDGVANGTFKNSISRPSLLSAKGAQRHNESPAFLVPDHTVNAFPQLLRRQHRGMRDSD